MITFKSKGDFKLTTKFLQKLRHQNVYEVLEKYGKKGVEALRHATPKDTGKTAMSWEYTVELTESGYSLSFHNTNVVDGWANVAILLQYGHATRSGTWVEGVDYINPALQPIFDQIAQDIWKEVENG